MSLIPPAAHLGAPVSSCVLIASVVFVTGLSNTSAHGALVTRNVNQTLIANNIESYDLDVDGDSTVDFTFDSANAPDPVLAVAFDQINFRFASTNAAVIDSTTGDGFPAVKLLAPGAVVSPASLFSGPNDKGNLFFYVSIDPAPTGNFGGRTGFAGFRFDAPVGTLYGYVELTVNALSAPTNPGGLTIGRLTFNDVAGQSVVVVPEPASLTLIAASGAILLRRRPRA